MKSLLSLLFLPLFILSVYGQKEITPEAIWRDYTFYGNSVPGFYFLNDGKTYVRLEGNQINKYDITDGKLVSTLFDLSEANAEKPEKIDGYTFNNDQNKLLLRSETESIYRRSSKSFYYILNNDDLSLTPVFKKGKIMYATWSPDGKKIAFVFENNLYVRDVATGKMNQITKDGKKNHIINGSADWVYEEEFAFAKAFEWSPDSKKIAYYRFDETMVREFTMTLHHDDAYPVYETFKYPKVGEKNSGVGIFMYDLDAGHLMKAPEDPEVGEYIPRIKWSNDPNQLCVFYMNRHQNHLKLKLTHAHTGEQRTILEEKSKYYIDIHDNLDFLDDGERFLWTSERDGYNHIYMHNLTAQKAKFRQLTQGEWDVTEVYGLDEKNNKLYYQSGEKSPLERQVYELGLKKLKKRILTDRSGWNSAQFSKTFEYWVWNHSAAGVPASYKVMKRSGGLVRMLEENIEQNQKLGEYNIQDVEFLQIPGQEGQLNAMMIKPPNFDENKEYPLFMYVYGGPGSQTVRNSFGGMNNWWFQMLAQKGYIVVSVDNRGTGARGEEFKKMTYLELGKYETEDQTAAARHFGSLPYIDAERIGIFGWSYGGYMSSLCMFKSADVFKLGIAVAPVTNWKWYDTIYTERYMRTNEENADGYKNNSPVYFADGLKGKYLLVHGMADDNVHFQNTAEMANALIAANKQFDTYFYPNRNHGIYGDNARLHLYTKMTNFILENL